MRCSSRLFSLALLALLASGCAHPAPVNYAPSSVMTASGTLSVGNFTYLPAASHAPAAEPGGMAQGVAPNQIRNTAMGNIYIDRDVSLFVRNAVFAELRFVGVRTDNPDRVLRGDIQEFFIDDLGYSVDWTLRIRYQLLTKGSAKRPSYDSVKEIKRTTGKFMNPFGALNEAIKLNVEELLKDQAFLDAIR